MGRVSIVSRVRVRDRVRVIRWTLAQRRHTEHTAVVGRVLRLAYF